MKRLIIVLSLFLTNCSFDNKTGIWKNNEKIDVSIEDRFKDFKILYSEEKTFNSIVTPPRNYKIELNPIKKALLWTEEFYQESNKYENFSFLGKNELIFKSKKLTKYNTKDKILFDGESIIFSDVKGNIIIFSLDRNQIIYKYNFYKKKFKKVKKNINIIIENNIIYAGDNLGYIYALNYKTDKLLWAKNLKVPFRSNMKLSGDHIILADQDNILYIFNKFNGQKIRFIPTEEITLKNSFINSLASNNNFVFYLNTYGSLYSISRKNFNINWFINLHQSLVTSPSNLFYSHPLQIHEDKVIVSTKPHLFVINAINGSTIHKKPITSILKPAISGEHIFLVTKDNLLVCMNLKSGKIIYSINISQEIGVFLNTKNKSISVKFLSIINNNLFLFLNNSYVVQFNTIGSINKIVKLPNKMSSNPIFVKDSILYFNNKNKLVVVD
jgi:outer membrane protein assembly factor BamB